MVFAEVSVWVFYLQRARCVLGLFCLHTCSFLRFHMTNGPLSCGYPEEPDERWAARLDKNAPLQLPAMNDKAIELSDGSKIHLPGLSPDSGHKSESFARCS